MYENSINVCQTCLSQDRFLYPVKMLNYLLREVNVFFIHQNGGICWECKSIMNTFLKFKKQVTEAQETLSQKSQLASLSKLKININIINYMFINNDPLTSETKSYDIKQEINDNQRNDDFNTNQGMNFEKIDVYKEEETNIKDIEDYKDKYTQVICNKEEVIRAREKKRNQPNFKKIPFKCDTCVLGFTRKETFDFHMESKHSETIGKYFCDICYVRFSTSSSMRRHKDMHYLSYRCKFCKYTTSQLYAMMTHCKSKHPYDKLGVICCKQCTSTAETSEEMAAHIQMQHTLHCSECGEKFKGKDTLRRHKLRIHTTSREFICDICKKAFKTKSRLESHIVGHSATIAKKLAYCSACHIQYKNIYVYRNHLRNSSHHSERSYVCSDCNKSFVSKVYWRRHCEFYHLKKSSYSCEICNKLFISRWRLKTHKQTHHGLSRSRDHSCEECGKKFYTRRTLVSHQLTHSEQRSFMCETCGDTFRQRAALYTHNKMLHRGLASQ